MIHPFRSPRTPGHIVLLGCLLVAPSHARAATEIVATRLAPSSLSERFGSAAAVHAMSPGGTYVIPTRSGVEVRGTDAVRDTLYGSFRTAGIAQEVAVSGTTAYLFAGDRGIVALDVSDSTRPAAIQSHDHLGVIVHGAFAPGSATLAATTDADLFFFHERAPGVLDLVSTRGYGDGRRIVRVQARADSFLVLSLRTAPTLRMILTLYRVRSSAAPESLWEFQANGVLVEDLAWPDAVAFVAAGNTGVVPFDTETRTLLAGVSSASGQFIRSLSADAARVIAVGESRTYAAFLRGGPKGATLGPESDQLTAIEPFHVSIVGGRAIVSEDDGSPPPEPDEVGRSLIETFDATSASGGRIGFAGTGRVRRVVANQGLAYVADYSGGLRLYRVAPADTSLVGALPLGGTSRAFDVALDPARRLAYVAAGTGGLLVVDVKDPTSPATLATVSLAGTTVAVAVNGTTAVATRRGASVGVSVIDVSDSLAPLVRGSLNYPVFQDPRSVAIRDTVAYVADQLLGLTLVGFRNPGAPSLLGAPSGFGALDLDLSGTRLLVGTNDAGVPVVDVSDPVSVVVMGSLPTPTVYGVAQLGQSAVALLGDGGALAIDLRVPSVPRARGLIQVPGFAREAFWVGDTLLVAAGLSLERFLASASIGSDPSLNLSIEPASVLPHVSIAWSVPAPPGAIGWNVYREAGAATQGMAGTTEYRVNDELLDPAARGAVDRAVQGGQTYRYRLDAFFPDGSSRKAAEGAIYIPSNSALGRPYPNPYRPRNGLAVQIPYRVLSIDGGKSVLLRVYDLGGRLVRTITDTTAPGGGYGSMTWDGRNGQGRLLADGVYFLKLEGPGIKDARRLILLR